jgi:hypothetical protein
MKVRKRDHFAAIVAGYLVAAVVATISIFLLQSPMSEFDSRLFDMRFYLAGFYLSLFVALGGLPMFVPWLLASEWRNIRQPIPFFIAGIAIAAFVQVAMTLLFSAGLGSRTAGVDEFKLALLNSFQDILSTLSLCVAGSAGGLTYWVIAGRYSGAWKRMP